MAWVFMVVRQTPRGHPQNDIILITSHKAVSPPPRGGGLPRAPPPPPLGRQGACEGRRRRRPDTGSFHGCARCVYTEKQCCDVCVWENGCVCVNEEILLENERFVIIHCYTHAIKAHLL